MLPISATSATLRMHPMSGVIYVSHSDLISYRLSISIVVSIFQLCIFQEKREDSAYSPSSSGNYTAGSAANRNSCMSVYRVELLVPATHGSTNKRR